MSQLCIGCVADDFTGASDMASFLVKGGLITEMCDGIPSSSWKPAVNTQAVVIALKSRTEPVEQAVTQSLQCFEWLYKDLRAKQLYFKYCSTFDSTSEGNIGPVIDAVLARLNLKSAIISPALPVNGRTVYQGHLFVNGLPLEHSSMRNHPLTPMTDSNLMSLIESQGTGKASCVDHRIIERGEQALTEYIETLDNSQYLVLDHFNDAHAQVIAQTFSQHPFLSGSSGLAEPLANMHASTAVTLNSTMLSGAAPTLILAGSCSQATREQIAVFSKHYNCYQIDPQKLLSGELSLDTQLAWIAAQQNKPCLIYTSDDPATVSQLQQSLGNDLAGVLEKNFAQLARKAVENGVHRLIVAGGETSGAVTQALELQQFFVGPSIAPGVPVIQPRAFPQLLLSLKSGNFGDAQFFLKAVELMNTKQEETYV